MKNSKVLRSLLTLVLGAALIFGMLCLTGCDDITKPYSCQELNMQIPLFLRDTSSDPAYKDFTFVLDSNKLAVFGLRESIDRVGDMTLREYTDLVIQVNNFNTFVTETDKYCRFAFTNQGTYFQAYLYKSDDAFWMLQFAGPKDAYFSEIAETVNFD